MLNSVHVSMAGLTTYPAYRLVVEPFCALWPSTLKRASLRLQVTYRTKLSVHPDPVQLKSGVRVAVAPILPSAVQAVKRLFRCPDDAVAGDAFWHPIKSLRSLPP